MDTTEEERLSCRWAGCPEEFDDEAGWIKHVAVHVFNLKPGERTPWLGPPELDPDLLHAPVVGDDQSDGEDDDEDDRAFSQVNALSSPASTPPQVELPDSPDLAEKINGPSVSAVAIVEPLRLLSPEGPERSLSHRTSGSADDVEADLIPTSPTPSMILSQNATSNPNQESSLYMQLLSSHPPSMPTQIQSPSASVNRFRRAMFQVNSPAWTPVHSQSGMNMSQTQDQALASQTLQSQDGSQANDNGMSWLNTQAFRPPETQDSYDSD